MSLWRHLKHGFHGLTRRATADRDVADEVAHYLEETTARLTQEGLSPEDARRAAGLEVGNTVALREEVRASGWENAIDTIIADLRYGARWLRKSPGFVAVSALTLGLGIGARRAQIEQSAIVSLAAQRGERRGHVPGVDEGQLQRRAIDEAAQGFAFGLAAVEHEQRQRRVRRTRPELAVHHASERTTRRAVRRLAASGSATRRANVECEPFAAPRADARRRPLGSDAPPATGARASSRICSAMSVQLHLHGTCRWESVSVVDGPEAAAARRVIVAASEQIESRQPRLVAVFVTQVVATVVAPVAPVLVVPILVRTVPRALVARSPSRRIVVAKPARDLVARSLPKSSMVSSCHRYSPLFFSFVR